ncbi:MAG: YicC/YloC family endoribonuclease [Gammaproteobacteria bacterium]
MIHSMTAYGRQKATGAWGSIVWEMRSVNHRYLECHLRLPESLRPLEGKLRELVRGQLHRGKVDCYCHFSLGVESEGTMALNESLAKALIQANEQVNAWLPVPSHMTSMEVLQWPGVIQEKGALSSDILEQVQLVFTQSLAQLVACRRQEGEALQAILVERLTKINEKNQWLMTMQETLQTKQRERLKQRLDALQVEVEPERFEQEVVLLLQRLDIAEEIDRLKTHCAAFSKAIKLSGPVGRRLDFLLQEMNREVNTIGSKSTEIDITNEVVELKVLIEQMKEQVQNIE